MNYELFNKNTDVMKAKGTIPYWVIANRLNVHENTVRNWMKTEMDSDKKEKILSAIKEIKQEIKISSG